MSIQYLPKSVVPDAGVIGPELKSKGFGVYAYPYPPKYIMDFTVDTSTEILCVVRGSMKVTVNQQTYQLDPGDQLVIGRADKYAIEVTGETGVYYLAGKK